MSTKLPRQAPTLSAALHRSLGEHSSLGHRVRERLLADLHGGDIHMDVVARAMRMSIATLRRRLEAENTSFSTILDDVRQQSARQLLTESVLSVTQVSRRLGFSQVRAFTRAFQRWTGRSPSDFRRGTYDLSHIQAIRESTIASNHLSASVTKNER